MPSQASVLSDSFSVEIIPKALTLTVPTIAATEFRNGVDTTKSIQPDFLQGNYGSCGTQILVYTTTFLNGATQPSWIITEEPGVRIIASPEITEKITYKL